jgi:AbrB family looped-hinge helix DNA binding protein
MAHSVVTSKGQITIPISVRNKLNLKTGDRIDFKIENGAVKLVPLSKSVSDVFGILSKKLSTPVSVEQMNVKLKKTFKDKYK